MVYPSCETTEEIKRYQETPKISWNYRLVPSLPPKMKILSILAKNNGKIVIELFSQCAISHKN